MFKQTRPAAMEAFLERVNQTIFEVEELRMSLEYDAEDMQEAPAFENQLEQQSDYLLPFKGLLRQVNNTHRLGLES